MAATTAAAILACGMLRTIEKSMDLYTVSPSKALGVRGFGCGFGFKCGLVLYGSAMHWKLRQSKRGKTNMIHLSVFKMQQHRDAKQQAGARGRPRGQRH